MHARQLINLKKLKSHVFSYMARCTTNEASDALIESSGSKREFQKRAKLTSCLLLVSSAEMLTFWWLCHKNQTPIYFTLNNGVARTPKKLHTSKWDYWIKSSDSLQLHPFSKWELLLKERICSKRERILSFLPEGANSFI